MARDKTRLAHVPTRFWNGDEEGEDASWNEIEAGHGLVSVTPEYAAAQGLPDSLVHPRDPSLRIYVVEGYHSIHCLVCHLSYMDPPCVCSADAPLKAKPTPPLHEPPPWREA